MSGKKTIKTLLIGCGRIGAGSGNRNQRRQSHAGVLSTISSFDVTLFDPDTALARRAASVLRLSSIDRLDRSSLDGFQCAIVCSPTPTHFSYLSQLMVANVPLVVCEKPVCSSAEEIKKLKRLRARSSSRVLVNYTRRFQPAYVQMRKRMAALLQHEKPTSILVRYQRGFLNNASHALDLVRFLTGWETRHAKVHTVHAVNDEFPDDPTLSCHGEWNGALLSIVGLPHVRFSFFEVDFFFRRKAIRLRDRGDTIEICDSSESRGYYAPLATETVARDCLRASWENLYLLVKRMVHQPRLCDNFDEALDLANWVIKVGSGGLPNKFSLVTRSKR